MRPAAIGCAAVAVLFSGCTIEDQTPQPPHYSTTAPVGFPIQARVTWQLSAPSVTTTVDIPSGGEVFQIPRAVTMVGTGPSPRTYTGRFDPALPWATTRFYTSCGFRVKHEARLAGFTSGASHQIPGNPLVEFMAVATNGGYLEVVFPTGGGTVQTNEIGLPYEMVYLINGYAQPVTLQSVDLTCPDGACAGLIGNVGTPVPPPVTLSCGQYAALHVQCDIENSDKRQVPSIKFTTSRGIIITPLRCVPVIGA